MTEPQSSVRFDGRCAIVTGAGGGLGRIYALELARRGAAVVVNDLGADVGGQGESAAAAAVVREIEAAGGRAIADGGSVTDAGAMSAMAERAIAAFGRIDIVIANAGILRDKSFANMEMADFRAVVETHLFGAANVIKAAWETMRAQSYGRVVVATSSTGLYGNFGQANYAAAKMGLVGLMKTLRIEGAKHDIRVNALTPVAATRMTEAMMPEAIAQRLAPERVAPAALALCAESAPSGVILSAGAGAFSVTQVCESEPVLLGDAAGPEDVLAALPRLAGAAPLGSGSEHTGRLLAARPPQ